MTGHWYREGIRASIVLLSSLLLCTLEAREIHVRGDASHRHEDGEATHYRSITQAVQVAKPGDKVLVHPVEGGYRETVSLSGIAGGTPGNPILIDGQGSQLIGSDPISPEGWKFDEGNNLYERSDVKVRLFLVVEGKLVFASKETPATLQPGQWCEEKGSVYFKPPNGRRVEDLSIEAGVRSNGVEINGNTSHVIIKNFNARYFSNDGYNVHGNAKAIEFYNCNARDMGDEGFSSHGLAETLLDGAVYENCQNGIFNVNTGGRSISRNIVIRAPRAVGFGMTPRNGVAEHTLENALLLDCPVALRIGEKATVTNAIIISDQPGARLAVGMEHGGALERVAVSGASPVPLKIDKAGHFRLSRVSFNSGKAIQIRTEKPLADTVVFDACAVSKALRFNNGKSAFQVISQSGQGNMEFPLVSTAEFLEMLLAGKLPGPSSELIQKAIREVGRDE